MAPTKSRKLAKPERRAQLIETAKAILRECGADALTLGHLAERAGVSKPIAYEHFGTREGLLIALSQEIEDRHATYPLLVDPLLTSPSWTAESNQPSTDFGATLTTAGDVNGDGESDVIVGAALYAAARE